MLKHIYHKTVEFLFGPNKLSRPVLILLLFLIPVDLLIFSTKPSPSDEIYRKEFVSNNKTYSVIIPHNLHFAGEKVPLYDFTVMESLEREFIVNTYFHSQTILMHKRANRWLPLIAAILKKNKVPDDFKYIPLIESNLSQAISPKGATGFWQFVNSAAKQYGLVVNEEIDERYSIEKSTEAACRYFLDAYKQFGSWTLAAASYSMGIDGLKNQLEKQKTNSYYDLALNEETSRYIFRLLAVKEVISNPQNYGYQLRKKDLYPTIPTEKIYIDSSITDLALFAQQKKISYKIFKYFNSWLRKNSLTNPENQTYTLLIPHPDFNEEYLSFLSSSDSLGIKPMISLQDTMATLSADSLNSQ